MSGPDVTKAFNEFKNEVIVAPMEEKIYYFGKKAGRIGEAASILNKVYNI